MQDVLYVQIVLGQNVRGNIMKKIDLIEHFLRNESYIFMGGIRKRLTKSAVDIQLDDNIFELYLNTHIIFNKEILEQLVEAFNNEYLHEQQEYDDEPASQDYELQRTIRRSPRHPFKMDPSFYDSPTITYSKVDEMKAIAKSLKIDSRKMDNELSKLKASHQILDNFYFGIGKKSEKESGFLVSEALKTNILHNLGGYVMSIIQNKAKMKPIVFSYAMTVMVNFDGSVATVQKKAEIDIIRIAEMLDDVLFKDTEYYSFLLTPPAGIKAIHLKQAAQ